MLAITDIQYCIPSKQVSIADMQQAANLPHSMLKIFEKIYGLKQVLFCDDISIFDLLSKSIEKILLSSCIDLGEIKYLVHTHTSQLLIPFGVSLVQSIKNKFGFLEAIAFGTTMQKCVSSLKMFETLSILLNRPERASALIMTGEIAFTPELRLIPRSSISGDASATALVSNYGTDHILLSVETYHLPGYSKGFHLSNDELKNFDNQFIQVMVRTILRAVDKAGISLSDITVILPHNVNHPTWKNIAAALNVSINKVYIDNISYFGHCFTSDGFLNLALAQEKKLLKKGDYYLMAGCGMGFFFACAVFQF